MPASTLLEAAPHDGAAALARLGAALWPDGPTCPRRKRRFAVTAETVMDRSEVALPEGEVKADGPIVPTNAIEGCFSIFGRGVKGGVPALRREAPAPPRGGGRGRVRRPF